MSWLRTLCPFDVESDGLARALTDRGLTVDEIARAGDDTVLDVDVPANRPDCLGHLGVAREASAAFGVPLAPRPAPAATGGEPIESSAGVVVETPDLCPRYTARVVRGVRVGPSPRWVVDRLQACGLRSINNVVDASNLVLLELGQPIHTFDLERLGGATIVVRRARTGETLTTLDGVDRTLDPAMLVIADTDRPVALAGVMGGADTEIRSSTSNVLIESAAFEPSSVRATARRLGLRTDASHRFERGVDPEGIAESQEMAVRLLVELTGGIAAPGLLDLDSRTPARREIVLRRDRTRLLLGFDPGADAIRDALAALGLGPVPDGADRFRIVVPSWRRDLEREADVVEEVARHIGYDRIPCTLPLAPGIPAPRAADAELEERCRTILTGAGFREAMNYSMREAGEDDPFVPSSSPPALAVDNPISEQLAVLRRSLLPGLVRSVDHNARRGTEDVRLFEIGRVFAGRVDGGLPTEPLRVGIVWRGAAEPRHWSRVPSHARFHDLAGVVAAVLEQLRPPTAFRRSAPPDHAALDPVRSATWRAPDGRPVAWGGELHPSLIERWELPSGVLAAEIELSVLLELPEPEPRLAALPRVPGVSRDLSLVVRDDLDFTRVLDAIGEIPAPSPVELTVLDRYVGQGLAAGEASVTLRVILQPFEKSLTDPEIEAYRTELVRHLEAKLGIRLRD